MNKQKLPSLVPLLVLTLITVVMWVSFDIYRAFLKPADVNVPENVVRALVPTLDENVLNQIESRPYLDNSQIPDIVVGSASVPQIEPTSEPQEATESAVTP